MTNSSTSRPSASSQSNPRPFAFDVEFDPSGRVLRDGGTTKVSFTAAEVDAAKDQVRAETLAGVEAMTAKALERAADKLAASLLPVLPQLDQESQLLRREAVELSLAMARAVIGKAFDVLAIETIERGLEGLAESLRHTPRVRVRVAPDLLVPLGPVLERAAERHGLECRIDLVADPQARPGDWLFVWEAGSVGFDRDRALEDIVGLVRRRLDETAGKAAA